APARARPPAPPPAGLFDMFARLRPVVETGWEMPTLLHAVLGGAGEEAILAGWQPETWLADLGVAREAVAAELDRARDEWIGRDQAGWLGAHPFHPAVVQPPPSPGPRP